VQEEPIRAGSQQVPPTQLQPDTRNKREEPPLAVPPTFATVQNTSVFVAAETPPEVDNENTSDAQPLARSTLGLPLTTVQLPEAAASLLETLSNIAESDHNADAADTLLQ